MDFLKPAVDSAFSMSTIAAEQLGNPAQMNSRVSRLTGYIFGDNWSYAWVTIFDFSKLGGVD